ncbi:hypothetical protein BC936DRAFT_136739 [Jimgerdemannia flammicorona]|uniref:Uncharacterized protein n=1 Tax=Jimgerdemannia flammicorona TaxID=994334 RepID=A0A433CYW0_9FUNG|nr:hypothetical protein BC936DRAFT_136739 [Jimgerdemannia flammicorona]
MVSVCFSTLHLFTGNLYPGCLLESIPFCQFLVNFLYHSIIAFILYPVAVFYRCLNMKKVDPHIFKKICISVIRELRSSVIPRNVPRQRCIVPLPNLCRYCSGTLLDDWLFPHSAFTEIAATNNSDVLEIPFMKAVIDFKWRKYAGQRFLCLTALQVLNLIFFAIATTPGSADPNDPQIRGLFYAVVVLFAPNDLLPIHLLLVGIQLYRSRGVHSAPNSIVEPPRLYPALIRTADVFRHILPLLETRIFKPVGIFFNIVLNVVHVILPFLWFLLVIIVAFSHALNLLLDPAIPDAVRVPDIVTNHFTPFWISAKCVYLALTQDYSAFSNIDWLKLGFGYLSRDFLAYDRDFAFQPADRIVE